MKSLWQAPVREELKSRLARLTAQQAPGWGTLMYRHTDHHFRQFGI